MTGTATDLTALWLRRHRPAAPVRRRLLCFAHAGGGPSGFRTWPRRLPADVEVLAVRYPGRQDRVAEDCVERMEVLADRITEAALPLCEVPTALFGHSMGAWLAYEVALRLQHRHGVTPSVLLVSGQRAPHLPDRRAVDAEDDDSLIAEVRRLGAYEPELFDDPELRELIMPSIRADFRVVRHYRPTAGGVVHAPVAGYVGDADTDVPEADVREWAAVTSVGFTHRALPGGHFYLLDQEAELLRDIAQKLPAG
jgi:pyochelin biosynthesis protein PchC